MSSNLLKWNYINIEEEKRVIDHSRLDYEPQYETSSEEGEYYGEDYSGYDPEAGDMGEFDSEEQYAEALTSNVIKAEPVYTGPSPEELLEEAQEEIMRMRQEAEAELDQIRRRAHEEGKKEGYESGETQGYTVGFAQGEREGRQAAIINYEEDRKQLEAEYREAIRNLEPLFVRHISDIYEHIIGVSLSDYHDIVINLLSNCILKTEGSKNYIVHVSQDDYPFVSMKKKTLAEDLGNPNITFEIVEDMSLNKNECMVETDSGIFDCSLDVQLSELKKQLMLLSYAAGS